MHLVWHFGRLLWWLDLPSLNPSGYFLQTTSHLSSNCGSRLRAHASKQSEFCHAFFVRCVARMLDLHFARRRAAPSRSGSCWAPRLYTHCATGKFILEHKIQTIWHVTLHHSRVGNIILYQGRREKARKRETFLDNKESINETEREKKAREQRKKNEKIVTEK